MLKERWKTSKGSRAFTTSYYFWTIWVMGNWYYWRNKSKLVITTQVHPHGHGLFYQMDGSGPVTESKRRFCHRVLTRPYYDQVWGSNFPGFYNASYFWSIKLTTFANEKWIKLHYSANYYPQGNGLVESTNKNIIRILKMTVIDNKRIWHVALPNALWADRVTPKKSLGVSPYTLVDGK